MTKAEFTERLNDFINEQFLEFQEENDIKTGDLHFDLQIKLEVLTEKLSDVVIDCMEWQRRNARQNYYLFGIESDNK